MKCELVLLLALAACVPKEPVCRPAEATRGYANGKAVALDVPPELRWQCSRACASMHSLRCREAGDPAIDDPRIALRACVDVCVGVQLEGMFFIPRGLECAEAARDVAAIRACGVECR